MKQSTRQLRAELREAKREIKFLKYALELAHDPKFQLERVRYRQRLEHIGDPDTDPCVVKVLA